MENRKRCALNCGLSNSKCINAAFIIMCAFDSYCLVNVAYMAYILSFASSFVGTLRISLVQCSIGVQCQHSSVFWELTSVLHCFGPHNETTQIDVLLPKKTPIINPCYMWNVLFGGVTNSQIHF